MERRIRVRTRPPNPLGEGEVVLVAGTGGKGHIVRLRIDGDIGIERGRMLTDRSVTEPVFVADTLEQAMEDVRSDETGALALHSGPSKSADIGRIIVMGVHGPARVIAALVG